MGPIACAHSRRAFHLRPELQDLPNDLTQTALQSGCGWSVCSVLNGNETRLPEYTVHNMCPATQSHQCQPGILAEVQCTCCLHISSLTARYCLQRLRLQALSATARNADRCSHGLTAPADTEGRLLTFLVGAGVPKTMPAGSLPSQQCHARSITNQMTRVMPLPKPRQHTRMAAAHGQVHFLQRSFFQRQACCLRLVALSRTESDPHDADSMFASLWQTNGALGPKVVGLGSLGMDYLAQVAKFPKPDEKLRTESLEVHHLATQNLHLQPDLDQMRILKALNCGLLVSAHRRTSMSYSFLAHMYAILRKGMC